MIRKDRSHDTNDSSLPWLDAAHSQESPHRRVQGTQCSSVDQCCSRHGYRVRTTPAVPPHPAERDGATSCLRPSRVSEMPRPRRPAGSQQADRHRALEEPMTRERREMRSSILIPIRLRSHDDHSCPAPRLFV